MDNNMYRIKQKTRPVVFIHTGKGFYLKPIIRQAQKTCSRVVLLGDESNVGLCREHYYSADFKSELEDKFLKKYIHMSTNPHWFESICYIRYFRLMNFMERFGIKEAVMVDSDVLIYTDLSIYDFQGDIAGSVPKNSDKNWRWVAGPHIFFAKYNVLRQFVEYLCDSYEKDIKKLQEKWLFHVENNTKGGICDMTQLWFFLNSYSSKVKNLENPVVLFDNQRGIFDGGFYISQGCLMRKGMKVFQFKNGQPFFYDRDGEIRALAIHLCGRTKNYIDCIDKKITNRMMMKADYWFRRITSGAGKLWKLTWKQIRNSIGAGHY